MTVVLGILTSVGALGVAAALVVLHILPTGLSPLRDPVSQYAITRYGAGYRVATIAAALAGAAAAVLLAVSYTGVAAVITVILVALFAVARAKIGFFPMDAPDAVPTRTGRYHSVLAFTAFGSITAAAFVAGGTFHDAGHPDLATLSTAAGIVMALGAIGMLLAARISGARGYFGAAERLIYLGFIAWFLAVGVTAVAG